MSARIWFDRTVPTETPANVFSRFRGQYFQDVLMVNQKGGEDATLMTEMGMKDQT